MNAINFLDEAVSSVFGQSYETWELLLVDDGSTDGSTEVARGLAGAHPDRVRYLEHPGHANRGMSASRNLGIAAARGEYVALLDADDVWLPDKLLRQVEVLRRHHDAMVTYDQTRHWYSWNGEEGSERFERLRKLGMPADTLVQPPQLIPLLLCGDAETPGTCSVLIRRKAFEQVGGFVESFTGMFEDQAFFYKAFLNLPVYVASGVTALYRQHPASSCHTAARMGVHDLAGGGRAESAFVDWLSSYVVQRLDGYDPGAGQLPDYLQEYFRRRADGLGAGRPAVDPTSRPRWRRVAAHWPDAMAKWVACWPWPRRFFSAIRVRWERIFR